MSRVLTLTSFLVRDLFASLAGVVPLAAALAFGVIAFEYGMDQAQFITVAGIGIGVICFLTTLLLAGRADRAAFYPLVARLRHRAELLAALVLGSLGITAVLAMGITAMNLAVGRLTLDWPSALWILPTWLVFWLFAAVLALPLSVLVGREGTHLVGYLVVVGVLVANDRRVWLEGHGLGWANNLVGKMLWPFSTLMSRASNGVHNQGYWLALALTLACAFVLFCMAATLFIDKDLLWSE